MSIVTTGINVAEPVVPAVATPLAKTITGVTPPVDVMRPVVPLTELTYVPAACLLLNVVQSAELKAPRLVAEAVGTFSVITGVVVPVATVELKSVPVVPNVNAATEVTVPPLDGLVFVTVKLGYVPVTLIPVPLVNATVWSGAVLVMLNVPLEVIGLPVMLMPVPAVAATDVTVPCGLAAVVTPVTCPCALVVMTGINVAEP